MTMLFCLVVAGAVLSVSEFSCPPAENRPETWFHLIGGNVSKQALTRDLESVRAAGLGGIQLFHGELTRNRGLWPGVEQPIPCLSPKWEETIVHAADECRRLGLTFKMQNCPGWSMAGGPWIDPKNAQRQLVWTTTFLKKGEGRGVRIPVSPLVCRDEPWRDYQDILTIAFPTPLGDAEGFIDPVDWDSSENISSLAAGKILKNGYGRYGWCALDSSERPAAFIIADFGEPRTVRSVEVDSPAFMSGAFAYEPKVRLALDVRDADEAPWRLLKRWDRLPKANWQDGDVPLPLAVPETTSRFFRVRFEYDVPIRIGRVLFSARAVPTDWRARVAQTLRALPGRDADVPEACCVDPEKIVDLSGRLRADGTLDWAAPETCTVLRFGHVCDGMRNGPAPADATGWECDKLSPRGIELNYANYIGRLAKGPLKGKIDGILLDSWECRTQTWTKGLDAGCFLPVLAGYIVGDMRATCAFADRWHRMISDLMHRNFYGRIRELAHADGLTVAFETSSGDVFAGDPLEPMKYADAPMCEFWAKPTDGFVGDINFKPVRPTASAAWLYGKRRVDAEAFADFTPDWSESPKSLKARANIHFAEGVTHLVLHTFTHNSQPGGRLPGTSFGGSIGTAFVPGQTWWPWMRNFTDFLARCSYMLELGEPVIDVWWDLGPRIDHVPDQKTPFPFGLKYGYVNRDPALQDKLRRAGARVFTGDLATADFSDIEPQVRVAVEDERNLVWFHRRTENEEIYFLATAPGRTFSGEVKLRERAEPITLTLASDEVVFCVLRRDGTCEFFDPQTGRAGRAPETPVRTQAVTGPWTLRFPEAEAPLTLERLVSWPDLDAPALQRNFSGTATYRTTFVWRGPAHGVFLDLGRVDVAARVRLNGHDLGRVWCAPYRFPVSAALRAGGNTLEIEVANTWFNALRYDQRRWPWNRRYWTTCWPDPDAEPQPSGLLGPVELKRIHAVNSSL